MTEKKPIFLRFRSSNLYVLVTVSMSLFTDMMVYSIIVPIMPFIVDALQKGLPPNSAPDPYHSEVSNGGDVSRETGILLACFGLGLLIGSPLLGYIADRVKHRQWPMIGGILGLVGSTFLFLYADAFWQLILARILEGFSDACVWTLGMCLIADTFPLDQLGKQMGRVLLFHSLGLVSGSPIGVLYNAFGYSAPFILCICLACTDLLLRLFLIERRNRPKEWFEKGTHTSDDNATIADLNHTHTENVVVETNIAQPIEKKNNKISVLLLLRQKRLIASLVVSLANGCAYSIFEPTLPVRLTTEWGYNSTQIGLVLLAQVIPTFVSSQLAGIATDRYGAKIVILVNMIVCAITILLAAIPNKNSPGGIAPLIVILVIQGFSAFAFITPVLPEIAYVVESVNEGNSTDGQAMSYGLFNITFALGGLVGPLLGGFLYQEVGFFYMCLVMCVFLLLCVPYAYFYVGEPGKLIVRPQDRKRNQIDIENEPKNE